MTIPPSRYAPPVTPTQDPDPSEPDNPDQTHDAWQASDDWDRLLAEGSVEIREFGGAECDDIAIDDNGRHIRYRGQLLTGGQETVPGAREWQSGDARYYCVADGERRHLLIIAGAGTLLIEDWNQGDLGIRLHDLHRPGSTRTGEHRSRGLRGTTRTPARRAPRQRPPRNHRQAPDAGDDEPEGEAGAAAPTAGHAVRQPTDDAPRAKRNARACDPSHHIT